MVGCSIDIANAYGLRLLSYSHSYSTLTALFKKDGYDFTSCNSVIDIVYNTDVNIPIAKLIFRSPVGKLL